MKIESEHDKKFEKHLADIRAEEQKKLELLDRSKRRDRDPHPTDEKILQDLNLGPLQTEEQINKEAWSRTWEQEKAERAEREQAWKREDRDAARQADRSMEAGMAKVEAGLPESARRREPARQEKSSQRQPKNESILDRIARIGKTASDPSKDRPNKAKKKGPEIGD